MSVSHDVIQRRVPCILGYADQDAQLCWSEVSLTIDEIRDVAASRERFLIAYVMLLVLPAVQQPTDEICYVQGFSQRLT